ncbi:hypothetical protein [Streptoalloteichus hindustanus]|uniref:Uncharacterized protein n=1 Tax=Streptoalloteichus hindustanus TaxID=2017 RepID=A0A1M4T830_STRHI|nr:hypothetical protein [Streptoalloteichus hindustanus]SHE40702.1 hypothetical protein SAMN05444320_1018 [Streptoalloteichus hindustanus]
MVVVVVGVGAGVGFGEVRGTVVVVGSGGRAEVGGAAVAWGALVDAAPLVEVADSGVDRGGADVVDELVVVPLVAVVAPDGATVVDVVTEAGPSEGVDVSSK